MENWCTAQLFGVTFVVISRSNSRIAILEDIVILKISQNY